MLNFFEKVLKKIWVFFIPWLITQQCFITLNAMLIVIIVKILFIILKDIYSFEKLHLGSWRTAWSQGWAWRARPEGRCWISWTPRASRITWPSCELKNLKRKFWYQDPICTMHSTNLTSFCDFFWFFHVGSSWCPWTERRPRNPGSTCESLCYSGNCTQPVENIECVLVIK